jgi:hypothetical protein
VSATRGNGLRRAALLLTLSLCCGFLAAAGNAYYGGRDFECFVRAGEIALGGGDPYDPAQYEAAAGLTGPRLAHDISRCGLRNPYPPWTTLLFTGLATLGLPLASSLWASLLIASTVLGIGWSWQLAGPRRVPWPVIAALVVLTEPFMLALAQGQFGGLYFALTAGAAVWLRERRGLSAGTALAGLALKPQTGLISGPVLLGLAVRDRQWRALVGAVAAFLAALAATLLIRPAWLVSWAAAPGELRGAAIIRNTTWDLATSLGSWTFGIAIIALLMLAVVVLVRGRRLEQTDLIGLGTAVSLVVAPYAWVHDFMVLALPWSLTLARASELRPARRRVLTFATLFVAGGLFWTFEVFIQVAQVDKSVLAIIPILTTLLLAIGIRWATGSATIRKTPEVT